MNSTFDFRNPDYLPVYQERLRRLEWLRAEPSRWGMIRAYYRDHPEALISDWGMTYDPRNVGTQIPPSMPFILFPKQIDFVRWVIDEWRGSRRGLAEKSRDMGISWVCAATAAAIALTHDEVAIGFGSALERLVDDSKSPKALFWKIRYFLEKLPPELTGEWSAKRNSSHMHIDIPLTRSVISGDAGDNIGRGDRASLYFVDEAASIARPELADAALSQTTNCRIDVSTPRGLANPFAQRRFDAATDPRDIFTFHWREDPRKDDEWYQAQKAKYPPIIIAQEIDLDYSASVEGVLIPSEWVQAAVDVDKKLGIEFTGAKAGALDVADEGIDLNALCATTGVRVDAVEAWSGKGSDIFATTAKAFDICDRLGLLELHYDADGLGAGVRGDARVLNASRADRPIKVEPFRGSGAVTQPEKPIPLAIHQNEVDRKDARKNGDYFLNAKAQGWWALRVRFERTYRAVQAKYLGDYHPDDLISLSSKVKDLAQLQQELSQATYKITTAGKVQVEKAPNGTRSPNRADAVMIRFAPRKVSWVNSLRK